MREGRQPATSPTQPPNLILPICAMLVPIGLPFIIVNFYLKRIILARKCIFGILNIFIILLFLFYNQSLGWKTKTLYILFHIPFQFTLPPPTLPYIFASVICQVFFCCGSDWFPYRRKIEVLILVHFTCKIMHQTTIKGYLGNALV